MSLSNTENLYRILPFDRAVEILKGSLYFSHPTSWEDPYEKIVLHDKAHAMFAQCWCRSGVSDAMWRIYSPNTMSVRIRTTRTKLEAAMEKAEGTRGRVRNVTYMPSANLTAKAEEIAARLAKGFTPKVAADLLYMKRSAFSHEKEVRALLYCENAPIEPLKGWAIKVDGHELVESVLFDPRVPNHIEGAMALYLRRKIGFKGVIQKSVLYTQPPVIDGRVPEADL